MIHQSDDVIGHQIIAVGARIARAPAVPAAIHQDHGVKCSDGRHLLAPIISVGQAAVQKDHR
jgi:hypothetical protein